jgi:putative lipoic acid-binding regulatory protein
MKKVNDDKTTANNRPALTFPCEFPIKVIGKADLEFQANVLQTVRKHFPQLGEAAAVTHYSKHNQYLSLTVTIQASSQEQLDAIYRELNAQPKVIMVL